MVEIRLADYKTDIQALLPLVAEFARHEQMYGESFPTENELRRMVREKEIIVFLAVVSDGSNSAVSYLRDATKTHSKNVGDKAATPQANARTSAVTSDATNKPQLCSLAGFAAFHFAFELEFKKRFIFLENLYLREPFRGKGLGKALMAHVARYTIRNSEMVEIRYKVCSKTNPDLASALAFYGRLGAVEATGYESWALDRNAMQQLALATEHHMPIITQHLTKKRQPQISMMKINSESNLTDLIELMEDDQAERGNINWRISEQELGQLLTETGKFGCYYLQVGDPVVSSSETWMCWTCDNAKPKITGYMAYVVEGDPFMGKTMALEGLYIKPVWRKHGLGSEMMKRIAVIALQEGFAQIGTWRVLSGEAVSAKFWDKMGAESLSSLGILDFQFDEERIRSMVNM